MTDDELKFFEDLAAHGRRQVSMQHLAVVADLDEQELARQVGRERLTEWDVALSEGRVVGGVIIPRKPPAIVSGRVPVDADARQATTPQVSASQPTKPLTRAEQIKELERRIYDAPDWRTYEIAQRSLDLLLAGDVEVKAAEPSSLKAMQADADAEFAARLLTPYAKIVPTEVLARDPRSGLTAWVPAKPLSRGEAITTAEHVAKQFNLADPAAVEPGIEVIPPKTKTVRIKKIVQRDAQENIETILEYDMEVPVGADGAPVCTCPPPSTSYIPPVVAQPGDLDEAPG